MQGINYSKNRNKLSYIATIRNFIFATSKNPFIFVLTMDEKDWILDNIRSLMVQTGIKEEYISNQIGISQGEFSKILSGQRKDYYKYLPQIAQSLKVSFHKLVTPSGMINYGEIRDNGIGQVNNLYHQNKELIEQLLNAKEEVINSQNEIIKSKNNEIKTLKEFLNKN